MPYRDKVTALFAVLPVIVALLAVVAIWTATAWDEGLVAAEFTMIGYGPMSIQAKPVDMLRLHLAVVIGASSLELIYLFGVLPALTCAFLSLEDVYSADLTTSVNATLGTVGGLIGALVTANLIGGPGPEFSARRLMRASRSDLAAIASGRWQPDTEVYSLRALDRAMQLAPGLEGEAAPGDVPRPDPLAETRVGISMLRLGGNRIPPGMATPVIDQALTALAAHFSHPPSVRADAALLDCIDASLSALVGIPSRCRNAMR